MPDDALSAVAQDQRVWSLTANALKKSVDRARWTTLGLSVAGAVLETWGAQIHRTDPQLAVALGYAGAAVLAIAAVVTHRWLGHERTQAWTMSRAGSESLKREMFLFGASAGPYASGNPEITLLERRDEIVAKLYSFQAYRVEPTEAVEAPGKLTVQTYLDKRITGPKGQIQFFRDRANRYARVRKWLDGVQFLLAVIAALLGAALTLTGRQAYGAWVAVITTVTGAVASHALAQRYEQLIVSYRATADRLASAKERWSAKGTGSLAELVETCEAILLTENQGWIAGADKAVVATQDAGTPPLVNASKR